MKNLICILIFISLISCSSVDYPKVEDSNKLINQYNTDLEKNEGLILKKNININNGKDLTLKIPSSTFNIVFSKFAQQKNDDITLDFWYSPNVVSKEINVLGIKSNNIIDLEGGKIILDLKNLSFENMNNNNIDGKIDIEGKGNLTVVGKSTGLSAKASPMLNLNLNDMVSFEVKNKDINLVLTAKPKQIKLKTRTSIKIFGLDIPWNQEIPLEVSQIIPPITIPLALETMIAFPLPAQKFSNDKIEYANYNLKFNQSQINTQNNKLEFKTNIEFIKK